MNDLKDLYVKMNIKEDEHGKQLSKSSHVFYLMGCRFFPHEVKSFFSEKVEVLFKRLQEQSRKVLETYHYNIFLELNVIQFVNKNNNVVNQELIDVPKWVEANFSKLNPKDKSLIIGFFLEEKNYKILQISQGIWF